MPEPSQLTEQTLRDKLRAPLPPEAIKQHPTKSFMSSINSAYIIERLNDVFGEDGWNATYRVVEAIRGDAMIVVECVLEISSLGIRRQTFGGNDNKDRGDAYKGACTDALTKAASQIGIAQDVYKGMHDADAQESGGKARKKIVKDEYETIDGVVTEYRRMGPTILWLQVHGNPIRVTDKVLIEQLGNCQSKRVELRCRWDKIGKEKRPVLTVMNVMGVYEPVPTTHYEPIEKQQPSGENIAPKLAFK